MPMSKAKSFSTFMMDAKDNLMKVKKEVSDINKERPIFEFEGNGIRAFVVTDEGNLAQFPYDGYDSGYHCSPEQAIFLAQWIFETFSVRTNNAKNKR